MALTTRRTQEVSHAKRTAGWRTENLAGDIIGGRMNGYQYILAKQTEWAKNRGLELIGSKVDRGRPMYTIDLDHNLFRPLRKDVRTSFEAGAGSELPDKMRAIHSSSALGVNVFQYWKSISAVPVIAAACGFCRRGSEVSCDIQFEEKSPIDGVPGIPPHIDVVIHNKPEASIKRFAIECKFSEAYGAFKRLGLKQKYLDCSHIWDDIPTLRALAQHICPDDNEFKHLHPAQLIKHILAMKGQVGPDGFRLLYLWYDVLGEQGKCHHDEVAKFARVTKEDGIKFHSLTYQELIARLANQERPEHPEYIRYLTERYL
jgi:hypothetical protein